jgi:hypothetical protein
LTKVKPEDEDMTFGLDGEDDVPDSDVKNEASSKSQVDGRRGSTRDDGISVMPEGNEVMIRTIPPDIGRVKLEDVRSSTYYFIHNFLTIFLGLFECSRVYASRSWGAFAEKELLSCWLDQAAR